jgi:glycosyltransferase involved in cell wall biosynthesis
MFRCVSVVIPTYNRNRILISTLKCIIKQLPPFHELLVIDQTSLHDYDTEKILEKYDSKNFIRWIRLKYPSIPKAMNTGLLHASHEIILFLDDDIIPNQNLVATHVFSHNHSDADLVAGRVIQPWDPEFKSEDCRVFPFTMKCKHWTDEFMGGNFSVRRSAAIKIGGFDENFVKVAYRFERDFADRLITAGGKILFEPSAIIKHLKLPNGGTRSYGNHLTTIKPNHAVGEYYYVLKHSKHSKRFWYILKRPFREVRTRFHLRKPWWIPIKLIGEIRALLQAISLYKNGPKYIQTFNACDRIIR